ncbi:hypothetical protein SAMN03159406_01811 [Rhizobium sp. NFR03]|nr:hypothetical protein SAMN03159406_01811 [Rhizobium sp. NFR03]
MNLGGRGMCVSGPSRPARIVMPGRGRDALCTARTTLGVESAR